MVKKQELHTATISQEKIIAPVSDELRELYNSGRFGELTGDRANYSLLEGLYLLEKEKLTVTKGKKTLTAEQLFDHALEIEPTFRIRYIVYKDLRNRGYIVKTALKFGADFRVYDRGIKPGEDHAKWIIFPVHENASFTWHEFSAKNRVAHSTRKKLLLAIVDEEGDVTYYECAWTRP